MTKRILMYFIAANTIIVMVVVAIILPERIHVLQSLREGIHLQERLLAVMQQNLYMYEENAATLAVLQTEKRGQVIIQPFGHAGAVITDVRNILHMQRLEEREFYTSGHTSHRVYNRYVSEIRTTLTAIGDYDNINAFIHELANYYRYLRIVRIQISKDASYSQLWLNFSIYEELNI
ncbi:MAG: hypothetical protein FWC91_04230 [Defluviitaleaceae bacterium]|nr:hypothetical protein [Defluviitaleaceae bacterium]